ncbi:hypothetical protein M011DRAFT_462580 [Sporormia fimetaria CBS 119925]|uniref:Uncharacterized protein n=1 Tax=Sporormia fimetaria CBS 119925 TaxID=1340428 RepID=A0A6A6UZ00_9PLEO|nr:hypothetical protein M011DRAFT_462580 [Sporormia fimetaria CBS 119925]
MMQLPPDQRSWTWEKIYSKAKEDEVITQAIGLLPFHTAFHWQTNTTGQVKFLIRDDPDESSRAWAFISPYQDVGFPNTVEITQTLETPKHSRRNAFWKPVCKAQWEACHLTELKCVSHPFWEPFEEFCSKITDKQPTTSPHPRDSEEAELPAPPSPNPDVSETRETSESSTSNQETADPEAERTSLEQIMENAYKAIKKHYKEVGREDKRLKAQLRDLESKTRAAAKERDEAVQQAQLEKERADAAEKRANDAEKTLHDLQNLLNGRTSLQSK